VRGGVKTQKYKMTTNLSFQKIATVPASGLVVGRIYFETSTGMIKVATSATAVDKFGDGVKSASWDKSAKTLKIINESGEEISLNLSDVASASAVTTELEKKLNIGTLEDTPSTQSYYGLKAHVGAEKLSAITAAKSYTDTKISKIPAAIVYKGDDTTVTQSGTSTVTFAVGEIPQSKVTSLITDLDAKATTTALNEVKATADAAAPQATTYTKEEVDNKVASAVGSVYKMKGSVDDASALTALTGVVIGDVYNVVAAGTLNGEAFEAGSNFVAIKAGAGSQTGMWDKLGGTINLSAYAKEAEVPTLTAFNSLTTTVDGKVTANANITAGTKCKITYDAKGLVTAGANLEESDIPTLAISKISGLDTALNGKVPTTRKVNGKALSKDIELVGDDIYVYNTSSAGSTVEEALEDLYTKVSQAAASGVQSFGGQTGAITVDTANTTNGQVKFSMSSEQLKGTVNGLKSAAYTESSDYATSAQGTKADSALQQANIATGSANGTISVKGTDVPVKGLNSAAYVATSAFDTAGAATTALNSAKAYANGLMTWAEFE
jgi:hypothetical protein